MDFKKNAHIINLERPPSKYNILQFSLWRELNHSVYIVYSMLSPMLSTVHSGLSPFRCWVHSRLSPILSSVHSQFSPFWVQSIRGWAHWGLSLFGVESIRGSVHSGLSSFGVQSHSGWVHSEKSPILGSVVLGSVGESSCFVNICCHLVHSLSSLNLGF
jgi:hypothetical protein